MVFSKISVLIIAHNREKIIGSTVMILRKYLTGTNPMITVIDNGSMDRTSDIANKVGAKVIRYRIKRERRDIIEKAIMKGAEEDSNIIYILDLKGENTAEDVIQLYKRGKKYGDKFASGYVEPYVGTDTIGCLGLHKDMISKVLKNQGEIKEFLLNLARSGNLNIHNISEILYQPSKKRRKDRIKLKLSLSLKKFSDLRTNHPLSFFGGTGLIFFTLGMITTFYTVDYFYTHQHLAYLPAFLTVLFIMISGFLFFAGLLINSFNSLIEKLNAYYKWIE